MARNKIDSSILDTYAQNTWCPGCFNFVIEGVVKEAILELTKKGLKIEDFVLVSGIGCHAKIVDYINTNSFYSIHGRVIPVATGIKLANPNLKVIGFEGDGDAYNEGIAHLVSAARKNTDITVVIHDNRVFALTTGQYTATSPIGFKGKSTPQGSLERPFNPIELMIASGATFVARSYAGNPAHLKRILKKATEHKGFSFVEVLQPCVSFFNPAKFYNEKIYKLEDINHNSSNYKEALARAREWDYSDSKGDIPIGIFYQVQRTTYEEMILKGKKLLNSKISQKFQEILREKI